MLKVDLLQTMKNGHMTSTDFKGLMIPTCMHTVNPVIEGQSMGNRTLIFPYK